MKQNKIRKVFLEEIPRLKHKTGKIKFNWIMSINYKVKFIYDNIKGYVEIIRYDKDKQQLIIKYMDNEFPILTDDFIKASLGKVVGKYTSEFKIDIGSKFKDDKRNMVITDVKIRPKERTNKQGRKNILNQKIYKYNCNICGFDCGEHYAIRKKKYEDELWIEESNLLRGVGCSCCGNSPKIVVKGINDISTTDKWMIPIINDDEFCKTHTHSCTDEIYPICPDCGTQRNKKIKVYSIYQTHSIGCPKCSDGISIPNKMMFNVMKQLQINFETEYSPDWISPKRYDFYFKFNNKKYILEMDGGLGHGKKNYKNNMPSDESQNIDDYKDEQARLHGIEVVRIDCDYNNDSFEYIKNNILNDIKLNNLFDLRKINWTEVIEYACSNLVKVVSEYKSVNNNITTLEISQIIKYNRTTIIRWLKQGNEVGWCHYDGKEELRKNGKNNGEKNTKPIEIFKNKISLGVFKSISDLVRKSEMIFGIKLLRGGIWAVCNGKRENYKSYTFKYI